MHNTCTETACSPNVCSKVCSSSSPQLPSCVGYVHPRNVQVLHYFCFLLATGHLASLKFVKTNSKSFSQSLHNRFTKIHNSPYSFTSYHVSTTYSGTSHLLPSAFTSDLHLKTSLEIHNKAMILMSMNTYCTYSYNVINQNIITNINEWKCHK